MFDAINEILAYMRPNQIYGKPQMWEQRRHEPAKWGTLDEVKAKLRDKLYLYISFEAGSLP